MTWSKEAKDSRMESTTSISARQLESKSKKRVRRVWWSMFGECLVRECEAEDLYAGHCLTRTGARQRVQNHANKAEAAPQPINNRVCHTFHNPENQASALTVQCDDQCHGIKVYLENRCDQRY